METYDYWDDPSLQVLVSKNLNELLDCDIIPKNQQSIITTKSNIKKIFIETNWYSGLTSFVAHIYEYFNKNNIKYKLIVEIDDIKIWGKYQHFISLDILPDGN